MNKELENLGKIAKDTGVSKEKLRILILVNNQIEELNKKENYSLEGKRKLCCQTQLSILRDAILGESEQ